MSNTSLQSQWRVPAPPGYPRPSHLLPWSKPVGAEASGALATAFGRHAKPHGGLGAGVGDFNLQKLPSRGLQTLWQNKIIFFSHQWLSWIRPDNPGNVHYKFMVDALDAIAAQMRWQQESCYLWGDY